MSEHRSKVVKAGLVHNLEVLSSAPSTLAQYDPSQWAQYHALPLHIATAARINHTACMERFAWPQWRRRIEEILQS